MRRACLFAFLFALLAVTGCRLLGWNAHGFARAWDDFRCDRRVATIENLCLSTEESDATECHTTPALYNSALAYLYSRGVSEVIFSGRTTAHGTIAEFRALNAGFSSIPDPTYRNGRATITWTVPRTYRFAPEDTQGKYHPSTFWPRIFNTPWSDTYVASDKDQTSALLPLSPPAFFLKSYYGSRCRIQEIAYVTRADDNDRASPPRSWTVVKEWNAQPRDPSTMR